MPRRHLVSLWPRELSHQCARLQAQSINHSLAPFTSSRRSLCTLPFTPRLHASQLQNNSTQQPPTPCTSVNAQSYRSASRLARALAPRPGTVAETYVAYGMTQRLFEVCSSQADYRIPQLQEKGAQVPKTEAGEDLGVGEGWWYQELGLVPTFSTWSQVTFLHMYLLTVRLRALPNHDSLQTYSRHLIDHFSHNAEYRMDELHGLTSRTIRNKFLKDLFIQWRGVLAAYDEGLIKGDAVLGAAVWRNLWKASYNSPDGKDIEWEKVARVVAYMRRVLSELSKVEEADLIFQLGSKTGGKPGIFSPSELDNMLVKRESRR
ncbi:ubiquinol-cytochrome C chaperone-domain-containing protein [Aspergillus cavernicola]|uniref:Ubiquinol-cytochrome C chaperone-domain-containing protein n=1 Tax=Aspergillus cavernicola TaxID=176166 RepID=A0ABR4IAD0_9EURO